MTRGEPICTRCGKAGHVAASCPLQLPHPHIISVTVPVRLYSEANERIHWAALAKRKKAQKEAVGWALKAHKRPAAERMTVLITRIGPRRLDDDNLANGAKALRDAIASWAGIDDGSERIRWVYDQTTGSRLAGGANEYAVNVVINWSEKCDAPSAVEA